MTENTVYKYDDGNGKRGLEATYMLRDTTLYVKIPGSDHWWDYLVNFAAWPRVCRQMTGQGKFHRKWWQMAYTLFCHLWKEMDDQAQSVKRVEIIGHSMGGAVAVTLGLMLPTRVYRKVTVINAPKCGDKAAMWAVRATYMELLALYDAGDVVHRLPLFYTAYPLRSRRQYASTRGIGAAHNNMPAEWGEFEI